MSQPFSGRSVSASLALSCLGAIGSTQGRVHTVDVVAPDHGALWTLDLNADGSLESQAEIGGVSGNPAEHLNDNGFFGSAAATLGDIDHDGRLEIAVGTYGLDDQRGGVWILSRADSALVERMSLIRVTAVEPPDTAEKRFGYALAAVGDLDADGIPELAVGAPASSFGRGSVRILFLAADGRVRGSQRIGEGRGGFQDLLSHDSSFGSGLAALGDIDGDGAPELAVGLSSPDGGVYVLSLGPDGSVGAQHKIGQLSGGFTGAIDGEAFGASVAAIGDVDGDGIGDLAVGAPRCDDGGRDRGAVWILFLQHDGTVRAHQKISRTVGGFAPTGTPIQFGSSVAPLGDRDGDGTPDIVVGAPASADSLLVLYLHPDGTCKSTVQPRVTGSRSNDALGSSLAALGDLDGDGRPDIAVGAVMRDGLVEGSFTSLQSAVDFARDGDTVLVRSGTYGGLTLVGRALDVVAERDALVNVEAGLVRDLPSGERVALNGLRFVGLPDRSPTPRFTATNVAGSLWLERCEFMPGQLTLSTPAILLDACRKVVFLGCRAEGSSQYELAYPGSSQMGHGLRLQGGCRVTAYDSEFRGAKGYSYEPATWKSFEGGIGILSTSASDELFASGCRIIGGEGDFFGVPLIDCSPGGAGLSSAGIARVLDCEVQGGAPGNDFGPCAQPGPDRLGNVVTVHGRNLRLSAPTLVRADEDLELDISGPRGAPVWMLSAAQPYRLFSAHDRGVLLVDPAATIEFLGFTDLSGELRVTRPAPALPFGLGAATTFVQVVYQDMGAGGSASTGKLGSVPPRFVLGSGRSITTLDASY